MDRYRKHRAPAERNLAVETAAGPAMVRVVDVNADGMRICGPLNVQTGEDFTASLACWEVSGVVQWVRRPYCAITFDSPAPEDAILELRGSAVSRNATAARMQDML